MSGHAQIYELPQQQQHEQHQDHHQQLHYTPSEGYNQQHYQQHYGAAYHHQSSFVGEPSDGHQQVISPAGTEYQPSSYFSSHPEQSDEHGHQQEYHQQSSLADQLPGEVGAGNFSFGANYQQQHYSNHHHQQQHNGSTYQQWAQSLPPYHGHHSSAAEGGAQPSPEAQAAVAAYDGHNAAG